MKKHFLIFFAMSIGLGSSFAFAEYNYQELIAKDYNEMREVINKYRGISVNGDTIVSSPDMESQLKDALTILLMRPDRDGISQSLIDPLREDIADYGSFPEFLNQTVQASIAIFKDKSHSIKKRTSHLFVLQNALTYAKGLDSDTVLKTIHKAKLRIPSDVTNELRFNAGIGQQASPSALALQFLKERLKESKSKKRREKKRKKRKKEEKAKSKSKEKSKEKSEVKSKEKSKEKSEVKKSKKKIYKDDTDDLF